MLIFWYSNYCRVGDHNTDEIEEDEKEYEIASMEIHPDFNVGPYLNNDIAIVTIGNLSESEEGMDGEGEGINFGMFVGAACLPPENFW